MLPLRAIYCQMLRRRLKNTNFTIISNNCVGGIIYHNLGERFNSPTINLFINDGDFLALVENLSEYLGQPLTEARDTGVDYPVGELSYGGRTVKIHFQHYRSFEEASEKWNERCTRINPSNIFIIHTAKKMSRGMIERFLSLPYKNKLIITGESYEGSADVVTHSIFNREDYKNGDILEYKSWLSCKRHLDDVDYIGFLNRGSR